MKLCTDVAGSNACPASRRRSTRKAFSGAKVAQPSLLANPILVNRQQRLICSAVAELTAAELRGRMLSIFVKQLKRLFGSDRMYRLLRNPIFLALLTAVSHRAAFCTSTRILLKL